MAELLNGFLDFKRNWKTGLGKFDDPTYMGFNILFDFNSPNSPLFAENDRVVEQSDEFGEIVTEGVVESAQKYFERIGDDDRVNKLKVFKELLYRINNETPWIWQSIEGLDSVWAYDFTDKKVWGGPDSKIIINTLETVDLRITALISLYQEIVYDYALRKIVLPANLRSFGMSIIVQEIRNFNTVRTKLSFNQGTKKSNSDVSDKSTKTNKDTGATESNDENDEILEDTFKVVNENSSYMYFNFYNCSFDMSEGSEFFSNISNANPDMKSQKISITYSNVQEELHFSVFDIIETPSDYQPPDSFKSDYKKDSYKDMSLARKGLNKIAGPIKDRANAFVDKKVQSLKNTRNLINSFGERAALNLINAGLDKLEGKLNKLILGNIYRGIGRTIQDVITNASLGNILR